MILRSVWILLLAFSANATQPVDMDEVTCALCHFEQGDEFSESVHYQRGLILCNDCHGGLPFEADDIVAKAEGTGYIGKPSRQQIAGLCATCHTASEVHFTSGPHGKWQVMDNPTCITCHHNHHVLEASADLLESKCTLCHDVGSNELQRWHRIVDALDGQRQRVVSVRTRLDTLAQEARALRPVLPLVEFAHGALREAEPGTHGLDTALIEAKVEESERELRKAEQRITDYFADLRQRKWIAAILWLFVAGNVALLWMRRNQPPT
jgi:hypothetical protein